MQHQKDLYKSATARSIGGISMMRPAGQNYSVYKAKPWPKLLRGRICVPNMRPCYVPEKFSLLYRRLYHLCLNTSNGISKLPAQSHVPRIGLPLSHFLCHATRNVVCDSHIGHHWIHTTRTRKHACIRNIKPLNIPNLAPRINNTLPRITAHSTRPHLMC